MKYSYFGITDIGCTRKKNADCFLTQVVRDEQSLLSVVADGIGGNEGSEIASRITCKEISNYFKDLQPQAFSLDFLKQAVTNANNSVISAQRAMPCYNEMSCVVVAALWDFANAAAHICHVGDARLYEYHNHDLTKITQDDSLTYTAEEFNMLPADAPQRILRRNVVTRFIGERQLLWNDNYIHTTSIPIKADAQYLICSDGLYDMVRSANIAHTLDERTDVQTKVEHLVQAAKDAGGKDNITAILIDTKQNDY